MNRAGLIPGVILVLLGLLFLLDALGVLAAGPTIGDWWPLVIVGIGLARLLDRPPDRVGGTITAAVGVLLLAFTLDAVDSSVFVYLWPLAVIGVGLWLLVGRRTPDTGGDDTVSAVVLLGGRELAPSSTCFRGGSLFVALGGIDLDLRGAQLDLEGARIDATVLFGGCDVKVPHGWRVRISGPAILGGYDNSTAREVLPPDAPTLDIRVLVAFGGLDVKAVGSPLASSEPATPSADYPGQPPPSGSGW